MQALDVANLKEFYSSILGRSVRKQLTTAIERIWPGLADDNLLALGYATPFLTHYVRGEKNSLQVVAGMLADSGAIYWPAHRANRGVLLDESQLPFRDNSLNRVLLVHGLECSEQMQTMLDELWRVLTPGGRLLVAVPNRRSIWARISHSPFAYGRPYTSAQLRDTLCSERFTFVQSTGTVFLLPSRHPLLLRLVSFSEWLGSWLFHGLGAVHLMEVEKQIYASLKEPRRRARITGLLPEATPAMSRGSR